ncbi:HAAS signaling domain-containing protein [Leucobacter denitrificans]|uniref:DUF1700 domain-containing protein n=1 Tax=Leucobacter denitrificans TaxID=683042 RepID=A0A7G9S6R0_9MICO|nr:hypothetical protein [Leucobacter denitrificans]QNN63535.1 hypothetical protein H9L06_04260 [Leucobacter denitrificans]
MTPEKFDRETADYLRVLTRELSDAPSSARDAAVDDVRAHVADALEGGASPQEALASLGSPTSFAAQYRVELGLPARENRVSMRAATALRLATVALSVLAGVFASFLARGFASVSMESSSSGVTTDSEIVYSTLSESYGPGFMLLAFAPALLALLPLVLPATWRTAVSLANAVVVTGFALLGILTVGSFYMPVAMLMWAAVIVPWRMQRGLRLAEAPIWRAVGAVVVVAPALLLGAGALSGSVELDLVAWLVMLCALVLAVLFAVGVRVSALIIASIGGAIMVLSMFSPGLLVLGTWIVGGLYFVLGLSSYLAWGSRKDA